MSVSNCELTIARFMGGTQLLVDMWGAKNLGDPTVPEVAIRKSVLAARATLLCVHVHKSFPEGCLSAIALLADSHIVLHTWPERSYAAVDILTRGNTDAATAASVLIETFQPERFEIRSLKRGYQFSTTSVR